MHLTGKTRGQLEALLGDKSKSELIDLVHSLVSLEPHLRPSEVARRAGLNKRFVLKALRTGDLSPYLALADNSLRIPISAVDRWLSRFRVSQPTKDKSYGDPSFR